MLTPVVLADYADTIQLTDRLDVRARSTNTQTPQVNVPGQQTTAPIAMDLANQAAVILHATNRSWTFALVYSPVVTLQDVETGIGTQPLNTPQLLQTASGLAAWQRRSTRLSLTQSLSYGTFNSQYLFQAGTPSATSSPGQVPPLMPNAPPAAATTTQLAPPPQNVKFGSTSTSVGLAEGIGRRASASIGGGYTAAGGLDESSRLILPLGYGPRADASFTYGVSRSVSATTHAHAELTDFTASQCYADDGTPLPSDISCHPKNELGLIGERLSDSLTRSTQVSVDGGVAVTRFRTDTALPLQTQVYPEGQATLSHRFGPRLGQQTLLTSVQAAPVLDLRTGRILYGVQGSVTLIEALNPVVTVSVDAVGGQTFPTDNPFASSIVRSDVDARFRMDRYGHVVLLVGESELWQSQGVLGGFFSVYGYAAVAVSTSAIRF
jgi:hypothetical protein